MDIQETRVNFAEDEDFKLQGISDADLLNACKYTGRSNLTRHIAGLNISTSSRDNSIVVTGIGGEIVLYNNLEQFGDEPVVSYQRLVLCDTHGADKLKVYHLDGITFVAATVDDTTIWIAHIVGTRIQTFEYKVASVLTDVLVFRKPDDPELSLIMGFLNEEQSQREFMVGRLTEIISPNISMLIGIDTIDIKEFHGVLVAGVFGVLRPCVLYTDFRSYVRLVDIYNHTDVPLILHKVANQPNHSWFNIAKLLIDRMGGESGTDSCTIH